MFMVRDLFKFLDPLRYLQNGVS